MRQKCIELIIAPSRPMRWAKYVADYKSKHGAAPLLSSGASVTVVVASATPCAGDNTVVRSPRDIVSHPIRQFRGSARILSSRRADLINLSRRGMSRMHLCRSADMSHRISRYDGAEG